MAKSAVAKLLSGMGINIDPQDPAGSVLKMCGVTGDPKPIIDGFVQLPQLVQGFVDAQSRIEMKVDILMDIAERHSETLETIYNAQLSYANGYLPAGETNLTETCPDFTVVEEILQ